MKRIVTKIGDIFAAKIDENNKKYFQYVANDLTQLNSDVIRVFKEKYPIDANPDLLEVVKGDIEFYAHCVIKWGIQDGLWGKVGKIRDVGEINVLFRDTNDLAQVPGEEPVKISDKWYIWKIGYEFYRIGMMTEEYKKAEYGLVFHPTQIIYRMQNGKYMTKFPE